MKPFTDTAHCRSRAHCRTCRTDAAWRASTGAPETCPFGVEEDKLPGQFRVRMRRKGCGTCQPVTVTFQATPVA